MVCKTLYFTLIYFKTLFIFNVVSFHIVGFELPLVACWGSGGSCDDPSVRVVWDGIHYTEAANKFIFEQISTGAFSDPPIPLKMACHRTVG